VIKKLDKTALKLKNQLKPMSGLPKWTFYLVTLPAYLLIYLGLEGMGIINGKYALSNHSTYSYGSQIIQIPIYGFVPSVQISPFFVITGLIIVGGVLVRYIKK
jgi:hypothetical protein